MTAAALTASKYELAQRCVGSFTLPWREERTAYSDAGTQRHATDEAAINAGDIPAALDERWPGFVWRAEVAYAYDVATGAARELGVGLGRAYGELAPFERAGTADVEGRLGDHLVIVDKKSYEEVTPPARNPQVRFLALAAARVHRPARVEVGISHELTGLQAVELDAFDLDLIPYEIRETELAVARARSDAREGRPVPFATGRQCRWCPAFHACPEQRRLTALVKRGDDDLELAMLTTVAEESDAPAVYQLWKRLGILHKRVGQSLHAHAAQRSIPIGNGRVFGRHERPGDREYDGRKMHEVVAEKLGRDVADRVVEMTATQAQLERIVKPLVQRGEFAATKRDILTQVEKRGGMKRPTITVIEEYEPELPLVTDEQPALTAGGGSPF